MCFASKKVIFINIGVSKMEKSMSEEQIYELARKRAGAKRGSES